MYHAEMTTIDKKHIDEMSSIFWNFLWKDKHVPISKVTCTLPKRLGGLNLPNIEILIKVRRIKMLIDIIRCKDTWNIIARKHMFMFSRYQIWNDAFFLHKCK